MRSPDGWSVVAALAKADAQLSCARDLRRVVEHRAAFIAAQAAEVSLNDIWGRLLRFAPPELTNEALELVLERVDMAEDQLTIGCAGTKPDEPRWEVAARILRSRGYSGAQVLRALKPKYVSKSAAEIRSPKRKPERLGAEHASALGEELASLRRARCTALATGPELLSKRRVEGPATEAAVGAHLCALHVEALDQRIGEHVLLIDNIKRPLIEAREPRSSPRIRAKLARVEKDRLRDRPRNGAK